MFVALGFKSVLDCVPAHDQFAINHLVEKLEPNVDSGDNYAQALTAKRTWRQSKPCSGRQVSWQETSSFVAGNLIERKTPGFTAGGLFIYAGGGLGKP
jgi:hypothetical protein